MPRPDRFARHRWLAERRARVVHDADAAGAACGLEALAASGGVVSFGPDTLAEARNRGYRPCRRCAGGRAG